MSCDVGEVTERFENELCSPTSQLILLPFRRFTYVTAHSPTLPSLLLRHSTFSNFLLLLLRHRLFTYVIWQPPMVEDLFLQIINESIGCDLTYGFLVLFLPFRREMRHKIGSDVCVSSLSVCL